MFKEKYWQFKQSFAGGMAGNRLPSGYIFRCGADEVDTVGLSVSELYPLVDPVLHSIISADGGSTKRDDADIVTLALASPLLNKSTMCGSVTKGIVFYNYRTTIEATMAKACKAMSAVYTPVRPVTLAGGDAPVLAIGSKLLVSGYAGPGVRVSRADAAELDIYFVNDYLDQVALDAFLGSSFGCIVTMYDQTGNGNHCDEQTESYRPYMVKVLGRSEWQIVSMRSRLSIPSSASVSSQAFNIFSVIEGGIMGASAVMDIGTGAGDGKFWTFEQEATPVSHYQGDTGVGPNIVQYKKCIVEGEGSAARTMQSQDGVALVGSPRPLADFVGGWVGYLTDNDYYAQKAYQHCYVQYGRILTSGQKAILYSALETQHRLSTSHDTAVFFDGDSITNTGGTNTASYYNEFVRQCIGRISSLDIAAYNAGRSGARVVNRAANYATEVSPFLSAITTPKIVLLHMGTNDLTQLGRTAAQIYADIVTYCTNAKADGALVITSTILPDKAWQNNATQAQTWADLNALIRNNWETFADEFVDFANDPVIGPLSATDNPLLYLDGLHPDQLGASYMATMGARAINALLAP